MECVFYQIRGSRRLSRMSGLQWARLRGPFGPCILILWRACPFFGTVGVNHEPRPSTEATVSRETVVHLRLYRYFSQWGWKPGSPMPTPRRASMTAILGRRLYVSGGLDGRKDLSVFEVYDSAQCAWGGRLPAIPREDSSNTCRCGVLVPASHQRKTVSRRRVAYFISAPGPSFRAGGGSDGCECVHHGGHDGRSILGDT